MHPEEIPTEDPNQEESKDERKDSKKEIERSDTQKSVDAEKAAMNSRKKY